MKKVNPRSCIVIGAGLAGLASARYLCQHGWSVTVLEARKRFGGRVFSYRFKGAPELVCELGGEWIGRDHQNIRKLCRALGLHLDLHQFGFAFWSGTSKAPTRWYRPGAWPFTSVSRRRFNELADAFKHSPWPARKELDRIDWWTRLRDAGFSEADLLTRDLMDSTDFGESIRMTSAYAGSTEYFDGNRTDEMDFKVRGGNDQLIEKLVADIRGNGGVLHDASPVVAVRQTASSVRVHVEGGAAPFKADNCICTIPAPSLRKIKWKPQLPEDQLQAAAELQYARIVKTAVLFDRRFWRRKRPYGFSVFTGRVSDFCFDSTYLQPGTRGILCSYAIGDKADDIAAEPHEKAIMDWIQQDMEDIVPPRKGRRARAIGIVRYPWRYDRDTGGAYALYRPGQWFTVRPVLGQPHRRVHLPGEHLADWQGFMEGAVTTGLDAAQCL